LTELDWVLSLIDQIGGWGVAIYLAWRIEKKLDLIVSKL